MDASARRSFQLGRYHCVESLAQGPLGETFRAKVYGVAGLEKQYALKQIDASVRVDPEARARLVEAARRYAALEHERIARLTEIHDEGDTLFLVVELARGIDLPRLLAHLRGRGEVLPVEQGVLIAVDVADALAAAQTQGVVHQGLYPGAISVLGEGDVRVSDFAIASALERPGFADDDALIGFTAYMAPERLAGAPPSTASEAWSLGAILYELSAGEPWLKGDSAAALAARRREAPVWTKLPAKPGLKELLTRLLADDPAARPQTPTELREVLAGLLGLEIGRARGGLQALARRALGRALTRTGSFAAVAIPSVSAPTLVEPPPQTPLPAGPRTLIGVATTTARPAQPSPSSMGRAWAPPRATGTMPVVRPEETTRAHTPTLNGLGDPPQMELAELPPSDSAQLTQPDALPQASIDSTIDATGDATGTAREMDAVGFDDGLTTPQSRTPEPPQDTAREERIEALDGPVLELNIADATQVELAPTPPPPPSGASSSYTTLPAMPPVAAPPIAEPQLQPLEATPPTPATAPPRFSEAVTLPSGAGQPVPLPSVQVRPPVEKLEQPPPPRSPVSSPGGVGRWLLVGLGLAGAVGLGLWLARERDTTPTLPRGAMVEAPRPIERPTVEEPAKPVETAKVEPAKPVETTKVEPAKPVETAKVEPAKPVAGQLLVETTPVGATVWIDGENRGPTPLKASVAPGKHRVALSLAGSKLAQKQITVEAAGTTLSQALEPARLPAEIAGSGGLKVRCRTTGELRILVDGHDTGLTCPNDERIAVQPGTHTIGLVSVKTGEVHEVEGEVGDDPNHSTRVYVRY